MGFSKKREYLKYAVALHSAYYNFWRVHRSLRVTPAMEAGIAESNREVREAGPFPAIPLTVIAATDHGPYFRKDNALLDRTIARLESYLHMADFGTCAIDWPLMDQWEQEIAEGKRAK